MKIKKGYSSHGIWSTFGEIKEIELERGNPFPSVNYPKDTPVIWINPTKRLALRYSFPASEWDRLTDIKQSLKPEEKKTMEEIKTIDINPMDVIIWKDPDKGYLVLRKKG